MVSIFASALLFLSLSTSYAEIIIALKPDKDPEKMLAERQRLESFLSPLLKEKVKVIVPLSSAVILEGFKNGTVDVGYLGSLDMYNARNQKAADLLLVGEIKGHTFYESYWLTKKDKPYKKIDDLKGKPIAFASRTSTSGYLIPHKSLVEKKLISEKQSPEKFFGAGNVWYGSGYMTAVERVLDGSAEAAAVSDYVFLGDKHLTVEQKSQLRILEKQGPVPTHTLAVRKSLPVERRNQIKKALLTLNEEKNWTLRDQLFTSKIVESKESEHLASLEMALELTGSDLLVK